MAYMIRYQHRKDKNKSQVQTSKWSAGPESESMNVSNVNFKNNPKSYQGTLS